MGWNPSMGRRGFTAVIIILLAMVATFILSPMLESLAKTLASDVTRPVLWAITTKAQGATVASLPAKESVTVVNNTTSFAERFGGSSMIYNPPVKVVKAIRYTSPTYTAPAPVQAKLPWGGCSSLHPYTDAPQPC